MADLPADFYSGQNFLGRPTHVGLTGGEPGTPGSLAAGVGAVGPSTTGGGLTGPSTATAGPSATSATPSGAPAGATGSTTGPTPGQDTFWSTVLGLGEAGIGALEKSVAGLAAPGGVTGSFTAAELAANPALKAFTPEEIGALKGAFGEPTAADLNLSESDVANLQGLARDFGLVPGAAQKVVNALTPKSVGDVAGLVGAANAAFGGPPEVGAAASGVKIGQGLLDATTLAPGVAESVLGGGEAAGTDIMGTAGVTPSVGAGALLGSAVGAITGGLNAGLSGHENRIVGEMAAGAIPFVGPAYQLGSGISASQNAAIEGKLQREAKSAVSDFRGNADVQAINANLGRLRSGDAGAVDAVANAIVQAQRLKTALDAPDGSSGIPAMQFVSSVFEAVRGTPAEAQLYAALAAKAPASGLIDRRSAAEQTPYAIATGFLGYAPGPPPAGVEAPAAPAQEFSFGSPSPAPLPTSDPFAAYRPPAPAPTPPAEGGQNLSGAGRNLNFLMAGAPHP